MTIEPRGSSARNIDRIQAIIDNLAAGRTTMNMASQALKGIRMNNSLHESHGPEGQKEVERAVEQASEELKAEAKAARSAGR